VEGLTQGTAQHTMWSFCWKMGGGRKINPTNQVILRHSPTGVHVESDGQRWLWPHLTFHIIFQARNSK